MTEVSNLVTDYLLAAIAAMLGLPLLLRPRYGLAARLWGCAFLASSMSALAGGTWHGFQRMLADDVLFWLWKAVIYGAGVFGLAAVGGSVVSAASGRYRQALLALIVAGAAVYAALMATRSDFIYVIYYGATAMALVLALHVYTAHRWRDPASPWMIAGVAVSVTGAAAQAGGLSLHEYFDNNDLFHVIQMLGLYLLFRGARQLGLCRPTASEGG